MATRRTRNSGPKVLKSRDIPSLAKFIQSKDCKNVVLMLGAGVSTAAGIPDFRSPKTGLYSNLARLNLPHPEAVFEIYFFRNNPVPFYTLAHELYPGKFRPTITHSFVRLLAEKDLLLKCFTQNIDTLERLAGVPEDKIIEAHGSFATQRCIDCSTPFDDELMKRHIMEKRIARCDRCKGLIKPDIVFFGESLPPQFIRSIPLIKEADLLIIIGTSLTVQPFASLANMVDADRCPRVLINMDQVGDIGSRPDDVVLLGKCDDAIKELCKELGWEDELLKVWEETAATLNNESAPVEVDESTVGEESALAERNERTSADPSEHEKEEEGEELRRTRALLDEVDSLTAAIEASLQLNGDSSESEDKDDSDAARPSVPSTHPPPHPSVLESKATPITTKANKSPSPNERKSTSASKTVKE